MILFINFQFNFKQWKARKSFNFSINKFSHFHTFSSLCVYEKNVLLNKEEALLWGNNKLRLIYKINNETILNIVLKQTTFSLSLLFQSPKYNKIPNCSNRSIYFPCSVFSITSYIFLKHTPRLIHHSQRTTMCMFLFVYQFNEQLHPFIMY